MKAVAGVLAHRDSVTNYLDIVGDACNLTALLTEDAKEEIKKTLASATFYVAVNKKMAFSASDDIIDLTLANMTS